MQSLTAFLLATILALALVPAPQAQRKLPPQREKTECGTVVSPTQIQAELARRNNTSLTTALGSPDPNNPVYLPMTIHIVRKNNGDFGLDLGELQIAMQDMNRMWQPMGVQFFIQGNIDYIDNDYFVPVQDDRRDRRALRKINPIPNTINVYFAYLANLCGESTFTDDEVQGILMSNSCTGTLNPSTFAHEVGHYFDLYHTHETSFAEECPSEINCQIAGDLVCDTAADPRLINPVTDLYRVDENCVYDNSATTPAGCDGTPYNPSVRNLMSYSRQTCRDEFTTGQRARAWQTLNTATNRTGLLSGWALYVDPKASKSNTQCTPTQPCNNLAKAVEAASDGNAIFLKPGAYHTSSLNDKKLTFQKWGNKEGVVNLQ